jgi:hypothetical protein
MEPLKIISVFLQTISNYSKTVKDLVFKKLQPKFNKK